VDKIMKTFEDGVPVCYDYDDFNSQHATSSMIAVLQAWLDVFGKYLTREQTESMKWTVKSVETQVVNFNEIGEILTVKGTLMSGWRLTSFMNTVLNRVYLDMAKMSEVINYAVHNGDDVYATCKSVRGAVQLFKQASELGVKAQISKTNIGTIGEFLRVDTRAKDTSGRQYLSRAISTSVHGRVEMAPANDYRELVRSLITRFDEVTQRGANERAVNIIKNKALEYADRLFDQKEEVRHRMTNTHPVQGGMNKMADVFPYRIEKVESAVNAFDEEEFIMLKPGIDDYANLVVEKLGISFDVPQRNQMFKKMVGALLRPIKRYEIVIETDDKMSVYRGLYKAWSGGEFTTQIALARTLGNVSAKTLPGIKGGLANMIRNSDDPIKLMSVLM